MGRHVEAATALAQVIKAEPTNIRAAERLRDVAAQGGAAELAEAATAHLVDSYLALGDRDMANRRLDQLIAAAPSHPERARLEKALGRGVVEALARTAQLSRDDADALDAWTDEAERTARADGGTPGELDVARLLTLPPAVRRRVLRRTAIAAGAPAGSLFARHIEEVDRLVTAWRGQRALNLPGRVEASRQGGRLVIRQS